MEKQGTPHLSFLLPTLFALLPYRSPQSLTSEVCQSEEAEDHGTILLHCHSVLQTHTER